MENQLCEAILNGKNIKVKCNHYTKIQTIQLNVDNPYLIKKQNELKNKQAEPCYSLLHLPVVGLIKPVGIALLFGGMVIGNFL